MAEEKSPQELVKEQVWAATSRVVILAAVFGAGFYVGYLQWGDAPRLAKDVEQLQNQVITLRNEREEIRSRTALLERDLENCRRQAGSGG